MSPSAEAGPGFPPGTRGGVVGGLRPAAAPASAVRVLIVEDNLPAYDANGNIMALVEWDNGNLTAEYEYSPFGETIRATGPNAAWNPFRFSSRYTDAETGLVYYGFRYYQPSLGRWLGRDPIEEKGGLNLYGFVNNNPVNAYDALGEMGISPQMMPVKLEFGGGRASQRIAGEDLQPFNFTPVAPSTGSGLPAFINGIQMGSGLDMSTADFNSGMYGNPLGPQTNQTNQGGSKSATVQGNHATVTVGPTKVEGYLDPAKPLPTPPTTATTNTSNYGDPSWDALSPQQQGTYIGNANYEAAAAERTQSGAAAVYNGFNQYSAALKFGAKWGNTIVNTEVGVLAAPEIAGGAIEGLGDVANLARSAGNKLTFRLVFRVVQLTTNYSESDLAVMQGVRTIEVAQSAANATETAASAARSLSAQAGPFIP